MLKFEISTMGIKKTGKLIDRFCKRTSGFTFWFIYRVRWQWARQITNKIPSRCLQHCRCAVYDCVNELKTIKLMMTNCLSSHCLCALRAFMWIHACIHSALPLIFCSTCSMQREELNRKLHSTAIIIIVVVVVIIFLRCRRLHSIYNYYIIKLSRSID